MDSSRTAATTPQVLIAGGGPVGLATAALLQRRGIRTLVLEADAGYCTGSRAICLSRRSLEILGWIGADRFVTDIGLPWVGGRSYFRDREVLHFTMPSDPTERFAPMVNVQQYYVEEAAHRALQACGGEVLWSTRLTDLRQDADGVEVDVVDVDGKVSSIRADWLIACDGGRSTVRERLGLQLEGVQYEGRYVIVDIEQETRRAVERLAWFDPPSNPGSTILMHRQPGNVWRIDYQIRDDEDPAQAVDPANVLPRVRSHLEMIGESAPWTPLWISIYNAKCLTLGDYRAGRVLFAGDAAHLVPIFGVRGLNSGLDDAGNLGWKLAAVIDGSAPVTLLTSYTSERLHAARENIAYGAKSTEFMAPPHFGFRLMREAALRVALENAAVGSLINPRQSTPVAYEASPLNQVGDRMTGVGEPAPEASIGHAEITHLSQLFGRVFVALVFSDEPSPPKHGASMNRLAVIRVARSGESTADVVVDFHGQAWDRYGVRPGEVVLVRPDGYVMGRRDAFDHRELVRSIDASLANEGAPS
ncbi:MAG: FAD-dependent monooxygenase [Burkholderiaceae bacterium]